MSDKDNTCGSLGKASMTKHGLMVRIWANFEIIDALYEDLGTTYMNKLLKMSWIYIGLGLALSFELVKNKTKNTRQMSYILCVQFTLEDVKSKRSDTTTKSSYTCVEKSHWQVNSSDFKSYFDTRMKYVLPFSDDC